MTLQTRLRSVTVGYPCVFGSCGAGGCLCLFALLFTSATQRWLPQTRHSSPAAARGLQNCLLPRAGPEGWGHTWPHRHPAPRCCRAPSPQPGPLRAWEHGAPRCCCACSCPGAPPSCANLPGSWRLPGVKQVLLTLPNWLPGGGGLFSI